MPARWMSGCARPDCPRHCRALSECAVRRGARQCSAIARDGFKHALLKLAKDKHDAGTATGVDVLRAQVQLANDKQALLVARTS
jgi:hypothetical protein